MEKKFISFVIYLHNDAERAGHFFKTVMPVIDSYFGQYELICVDDESTDNTAELVRDFARGSGHGNVISLIHMGFYQGMEASMNAGRDISIGDFVYEFDDLTADYDPSILIKAFETLLTGYDIVSVSGNRPKKLTSRLFYSLFNRTSRGNGKIGSETFRILSRRAINRVKSMGRYIPYRKAVYANCGLKTTALNYEPLSGVKGESVRPADSSMRTALAFDSFIYFTSFLEKFSLTVSVIFLAISLFMGVYIITDYFKVQKPVEGWMSTMGFLSIGFFGVFALLTIILKYLSVLLNLIFRQQRYLVSDVEKLN
ncbi:MAG: glycosyltransferase [Lachnospiraceae bacterium]|nr:glycosyltransferase [Lachnospiraceae bacterium]